MKISIFEDKTKLIDLESYVATRGLICANAGGGKSYAVRKLLEQSNKHIMSIIIDVEGEFRTLREKYDFLLIGDEGDVPLELSAAKLLPKKIMDLNVSTIIDISELERKDRIVYVKNFFTALMSLSKQYWKPCLIVLDEAHMFCGQQEKQESAGAVIDVGSRGRKRGYCLTALTQRISKLHKDVVAEANNVMIGRTSLDLDMKRAADILGLNKEDMLKLRELAPGEFYVFGTAINNKVEKHKIAKVNTTHPKVGMDLKHEKTKPTEKIKKALSVLKGLVKKEEQKAQKERDYIKEIAELKQEIQSKGRAQPVDLPKFTKVITELQKENKNLHSEHKQITAKYQRTITGLTQKMQKAANILSEKTNIAIPQFPKEKIISTPTITQKEYLPQPRVAKIQQTRNDSAPTGGQMRMLKATVMYYPNSITKQRMASISGMSYKSGTFNTYLTNLKRNNFIEQQNNNFTATNEGCNIAGDVEQIPTDSESLILMWQGIVKGGAARMLKAITDTYPDSITKEEIGERAGLSHGSGTFNTYLTTLKRNGLIVRNNNEIKASEELFQ